MFGLMKVDKFDSSLRCCRVRVRVRVNGAEIKRNRSETYPCTDHEFTAKLDHFMNLPYNEVL